MKRLFLVLIIILLCSIFVSADPFRDIVIDVSTPYGEPVGNVFISMYQQYNDYYNYNGVTDSEGMIIFENVDARAWMPITPDEEVPVRGDLVITEPTGINSVPVKETVSEKVSKNFPLFYSRSDVVPHVMFPVRLFFFDFSSGASCEYDFIPKVYNASFSFIDDPIMLEFIVSDGSPVNTLPESIIIDEDDNHEIIMNLEDYIYDFENDFEDLEISLGSSNWNVIDGEINIVDGELIINFLPSIDLEYHVDNSVTFTISVEDLDDKSIEKTYVYEYVPEYKALHGYVIDLYSGVDIDDSVIDIENTNALTLFEDNDFIAFFDYGDNAILHITKEDYYDSNRLIEFNDDTYLDFTIVPDLYDGSLGYDPYMEGFDQSFRWLGSSTVRHIANVNLTICDANGWGYNPTPEEVAMVEDVLDYYYEATRGLITTHENGDTLIATSVDECVENAGIGFLFYHWNISIQGVGMNALYRDGHVAIGGKATYQAGAGQSTISQETMQLLGPHTDQDYIWPSVFCDSCDIADLPTDVDMAWCDWMYSRLLENYGPDTDPGSEQSRSFRNNNVYDEVRYDYTTYINGKEVYLSKLLGYSHIDVVVKDESEILQRKDLPVDAVIISEKISNTFSIIPPMKELSNKKKLMIEKLFI
jgi:hypothetical protein